MYIIIFITGVFILLLIKMNIKNEKFKMDNNISLKRRQNLTHELNKICIKFERENSVSSGSYIEISYRYLMVNLEKF